MKKEIATASVVVRALYAGTDHPISFKGEDIREQAETTTDVPGYALGELCARAMRRAWRTGIDGTDIELRVTFK